MGSFAQLITLKEEESSLLKIASKIKDQLNRLKVEELALASAVRSTSGDDTREMKQEQEEQEADSEDIYHEGTVQLEKLDLTIPNLGLIPEDAEEEEEDDDDDDDDEAGDYYHNDLTSFLQELNGGQGDR